MSVNAGFNQDQQGYLQVEGWSGTESKRRHHPHKPRVAPPETVVRYQVEYKTRGLLKRPGSTKWVPYSTRSMTQFTTPETTRLESGEYQFLRGGCLFRVDPGKVRVIHVPIEDSG